MATTKTTTVSLVGLSFLLLAGGASPVAAQGRQSCYPYCDYTHYYGPYDYRYLRPGLMCYPICGVDGTCAPNPACGGGRSRGRITVRSLAGTVTTTPTTATFYDPAVTAVPGRVRRARRR